MPWSQGAFNSVSPGQRLQVSNPFPNSVIYRVGLEITGLPTNTYRRLGYLSLFYGVINNAISYAALQPLGSVWEPGTVFQLPRGVSVNFIVFHRAKDGGSVYNARIWTNNTD